MSTNYTLGIEEEFQIVDRVSGELRSHVSEILDEGRKLLGEQVKPEMIQSMVEVGTGICQNIAEARADITNLRAVIGALARQKGLSIVAASTHPFSHWRDQQAFDDERYDLIIGEMQMVARSLLIFGLHVHVGVSSPERAIQIMNAARYFLPHILCLTTSSPFWLGTNTGLKSYRSKVFEKFPRSGVPDHFDSHGSFQRYIDLLIKTKSIDNAKKIWWDVRPHPFFPTLEFRVCDVPSRVDDTVAITALIQAIVATLDRLIDRNLGFRLYRRMLIQENKWRAVRYGLDGKLLDLGKQTEVPARDLILELLDFVDPVLDDLGSRKEVEHIHTILQRGTSADEQLRTFEQTGDLSQVVQMLIGHTMENVPHDFEPPPMVHVGQAASTK